MNSCPKCTTPSKPEDLFCGSCGFNLEFVEIAPAATQTELQASDIHFKLGMVYFDVGKYGLAVKTFEKILERDPQNAEVIEMCEKAREYQHQAVES